MSRSAHASRVLMAPALLLSLLVGSIGSTFATTPPPGECSGYTVFPPEPACSGQQPVPLSREEIPLCLSSFNREDQSSMWYRQHVAAVRRRGHPEFSECRQGEGNTRMECVSSWYYCHEVVYWWYVEHSNHRCLVAPDTQDAICGLPEPGTWCWEAAVNPLELEVWVIWPHSKITYGWADRDACVQHSGRPEVVE